MTPKLVLRMAALAAGSVALVASALADDGAWKVGDSYVIRFEHLDLSRSADRLALLIQIENSAAKLCRGLRTRAREQACVDDAVQKSLSAAPTPLQKAVETARLERDSQQQARR
jgi:UrcA family protein